MKFLDFTPKMDGLIYLIIYHMINISIQYENKECKENKDTSYQ